MNNFYIPQTISPEAQEYLAYLNQEAGSEPFPDPDDLEGWRTLYDRNEVYFLELDADIVAEFEPDLTETLVGSVPVIDIKPLGWQENSKLVIFLHGGAYVMFSARTSLVGSVPLADATGLRVISVDYSLAPFSRYPVAIDQVLEVFQTLIAGEHDAREIAFCGDSAGGALACGAALKLRDEGLPMPAAIVLWSPWSDISRSGDTYYTLAGQDTLDYEGQLRQAASAYAETEDHRLPYVSPVYADYDGGFPPTLIQGGTKEIFLSNFIRHYQALDQSGIDVKLDLYEGMWHVFQALGVGDIPEVQLALNKTDEWLRLHLDN
jgi:acetyl esterase/lipase